MILETGFVALKLSERPVRLSKVLEELRDRAGTKTILRWGVVTYDHDSMTCEVATATSIRPTPLPASAPNPWMSRFAPPLAVVIPTGVGARVGGFIGDAGPIIQTFEEICDTVVTHPNVVNGAGLVGLKKSYYTDGFTLDRFFEGAIRLGPPTLGPIAVILDHLDDVERALALNAIHAVRSVVGVNICAVATTAEPVRARVEKTRYGHFIGIVENAETLIAAAERCRDSGARAIAVVTNIDGVSPNDMTDHYHGNGPNPVGAVEALISRYVTATTGLPCAHAPAYGDVIGRLKGDVVDPRAASELITRSGLPSVLMGLPFSPQATVDAGIDVRNLTAIVVPSRCAGGSATLAAELHGIPLIEVQMNTCHLDVPQELFAYPRRFSVGTYAEAIGIYVALRAGIDPTRILDDGSKRVSLI